MEGSNTESEGKTKGQKTDQEKQENQLTSKGPKSVV